MGKCNKMKEFWEKISKITLDNNKFHPINKAAVQNHHITNFMGIQPHDTPDINKTR